jgi:hypothetical protein
MSAQTHSVDTDLWKRAVSEYTSKLSPAQRQAIMAPATVDECLQILITNSSRKRTFTRILESFRSIIDTLKRFEGSIDVLTQISTGIASPIWGPLRAAMTVSNFDVLSSMLPHLSDLFDNRKLHASDGE